MKDGTEHGSCDCGTCGCRGDAPGITTGTIPDLDRPVPPAALGQAGKQADGTTVALEVRVCLDTKDQLWSAQGMSPENESLCREWPGGGARHIAHGLALEAVRREVFACVLVQLTNNTEFLKEYEKAGPEERQRMEKSLSEQAWRSMAFSIPRMIAPSVQEVLEMLLQQK